MSGGCNRILFQSPGLQPGGLVPSSKEKQTGGYTSLGFTQLEHKGRGCPINESELKVISETSSNVLPDFRRNGFGVKLS